MPNDANSDLRSLENPANVRFNELRTICERHFGEPRVKGSHYIFKAPWPGDPRINLQHDGSDAKLYQVRQVVKALEKLRDMQSNGD